MGRYCEYTDVVARYRKVSDVNSISSIESNFIVYAEAELDQRLSGAFTTPFSSNNITIKDLSIDLTYAKVIRFDDPEKAALIDKHVSTSIQALLDGNSQMITSSGDSLAIESTADIPWSNTMSYHSAFGMVNDVYFKVSSNQIYDELEARDYD